MNDSATTIIEAIKNANNPVIVMDSRPDFDAICSVTIMHDYITNTLGKKLDVFFDGIIGDSERAIVGSYADISFINEQKCPLKDIDFSKYDLHIFLDSGNIEHICEENKFIPVVGLKTINIDHHAGNPSYGDLNYVKKVSSCCTALFLMFKESGVAVNAKLTNIYYLGMLLDAGFFQYITVSKEDFAMAAELVEMGANTYEISWKLNFNESLDELKFRAMVYGNVVYLPEHKVAYSVITQKELAERGIDMKKTFSTASDLLKRLNCVNFVFVIREDENTKGLYNLSFRSHAQDFDVLSLAKHFDGGGHKMAAGGTVIANSVEDVVGKVVAYINRLAKETNLQPQSS